MTSLLTSCCHEVSKPDGTCAVQEIKCLPAALSIWPVCLHLGFWPAPAGLEVVSTAGCLSSNESALLHCSAASCMQNISRYHETFSASCLHSAEPLSHTLYLEPKLPWAISQINTDAAGKTQSPEHSTTALAHVMQSAANEQQSLSSPD